MKKKNFKLIDIDYNRKRRKIDPSREYFKGVEGVPNEQLCLHPDHSKPRTRRDFLKTGLMGSAGYVATAPLLSLLLHKTGKAQELCESETGSSATDVRHITLDVQGGWSPGANFKGGPTHYTESDLNGSGVYPSLGYTGDPDDVDPSCGAPAFVNSGWHAGFTAIRDFFIALDPATYGILGTNISGGFIAGQSGNDSGDNAQAIVKTLAKYASGINQLTPLVGTQNTSTGINDDEHELLATIISTQIRNANDCAGLTDGGAATALLDAGHGDLIGAINDISQRQLAAVPNMIEIVATLIGCSVKAAEDVILNSPVDPDPRNNSALREVTNAATMNVQNPANGNAIFTADTDGMTERLEAIGGLVLQGMAGAGGIEFGGHDYHNNEVNSVRNRDFQIGAISAMYFAMAARLGVPVSSLDIATDGGAQGNGGNIDNTGFRSQPTGDSRPGGGRVWMCMDIAGKIQNRAPFTPSPNLPFQFGGWNTSGMMLNQNVRDSADKVVLQILALMGREGEFNQWMPGSSLTFNEWLGVNRAPSFGG